MTKSRTTADPNASTNPNTLLDALTQRGVLVHVSVRYWRARKKLRADDLGLSAERIDDRLISLGHKRLLPKVALRELALVEGRAHACVEENTFPFLGGVAHYLPNAKLADVTTRLNALRSDFEAASGAFMGKYADLRQQAREEWRGAAARLGVDEAHLLATIDAAFPLPHAMPRHFEFSVHLFQVTVPDVPHGELVALGTQQDLIAARAAAVQEAQQSIRDGCRDFVAECVATLREQTAELCEEMLATITGSGTVHQKTLNRLVTFIEHFKQLNFVNDTQMEAQLERVRQEFLGRDAAAYRDNAVAHRRLVHGLNTLRETARRMADSGAPELVATFGQLGTRKLNVA